MIAGTLNCNVSKLHGETFHTSSRVRPCTESSAARSLQVPFPRDFFSTIKLKMTVGKNTYKSVVLTRFFMKFVGIWQVETKREEIILKCALIYAILAIVFAILVVFVDLCHCLNDLYALTYNLCVALILVLIVVKFSNFLYYKKELMGLIRYAETNFWSVEYEKESGDILNDYDKRAVFLTYTFTVIVQLAALNYIFAPVFENLIRNETERNLPFKLWVNLPWEETPFYQIIYTIQSLSTFHSGVCTFCFDNFICVFNIHVAGQIKILSHRIRKAVNKYVEVEKSVDSIDFRKRRAAVCREIKNCVFQHRILIVYVEQMEHVFTIILLGQLLLSSVIICVGSFQFIAASNIVRKCIFVFIFAGCISQLLLYTWTCHDIIVQSSYISEAAYQTKWYLFPHDEYGKYIRFATLMIMIRARNPSTLTAGKFCTMSLETFTSVLSTAMSYFTLLRQMIVE